MTAVVELEFIVFHVFVSSLSTYVNKVVDLYSVPGSSGLKPS